MDRQTKFKIQTKREKVINSEKFITVSKTQNSILENNKTKKPFIGQVSKLNKNTVVVKNYDHNIQSLVETGATISCCSRQLLQLLNIHEHEIKSSVHKDAVGVGGELHPILGQIELPVTIGELSVNQAFHVFSKLHQSLILGIDFMEDNKVINSHLVTHKMNPEDEAVFLLANLVVDTASYVQPESIYVLDNNPAAQTPETDSSDNDQTDESLEFDFSESD